MTHAHVQPKLTRLTLYVPHSPSLGRIKHGSAIVGHEQGEFILCAYEGGIYSKMDFTEKLTIACWRLSERSPSVAYINAKPTDLHKCGTVSWDETLRAWVIESISDEAAFTDWFAESPTIGGTREQHCRAAGLILGNGRNVQAMIVYSQARQAQRDPVDAVVSYARLAG